MNELDTLIINPDTRQLFDNYLTSPSQALIIVATDGLYRDQIANILAKSTSENMMVIDPTNHDKQVKESINADDISELGNVVRAKNSAGLTVVIHRVELANAGIFERLLKLVEEPARGVRYIFTTNNLASIPQTIVSRCAVISMRTPPAADIDKLIAELPTDVRAKAKFIADGKPELIEAIKSDPKIIDKYATQISRAKEFIGGKPSRRLAIVSEITDRTEAIDWLIGLSKLFATPTLVKNVQPETWVRRSELIADTIEALTANGAVKLQLINLAIKF